MEIFFLFTNHNYGTCSFVLNTTISAPHEAGITAMCFRQDADSQTTMLVSTSKDGHFKAWLLAAPAHTEGKECNSVSDIARWLFLKCVFSEVNAHSKDLSK